MITEVQAPVTAFATNTQNSISAVFDPVPAGTRIVVVHSADDSPGVDAPAGYAIDFQRSHSGEHLIVSVFSKEADGTETDVTVTLTEGVNEPQQLAVFFLSGVDHNDPLAGTPSVIQQESGTSCTIPAVTTDAANAFLLAVIGGNNNVTSWSNTWTNDFTVRTAEQGANRALTTAVRTAATPGSYDTTETYETTARVIGTIIPYNPLPEGAVPDAPTDVVAVAGDGEATVSWTAPENEGDTPITDYEVTVSPEPESGAASRLVGSADTSYAFTDLANGTAYTFTVKAKNAAGLSAASAPSASVTPEAAPSTLPYYVVAQDNSLIGPCGVHVVRDDNTLS